MKNAAALLLALICLPLMAAAKEKPPTMTGYHESFSAPFDPRVPAVYPASIPVAAGGVRSIDDEFRSQSPSIVAAPRFVELDSKWTRYEPDAVKLAGLGIDPTRQMCLLSGSADKAWEGIMQDLPLPAVGETLNYSIVARGINAFVQPADVNVDYGPMSWGLVLGENMRAAPTTSDLWAVCAQLVRTDGAISGQTIAAALSAFDAPMTSDGSWNVFPLEWFRAKVQTSQVSAGVYTSVLNFAVSANGFGWQDIWGYELSVPLRQFALAQRSINGDGLGTWFDFVRYLPIAETDGDQDPNLGLPLQLGSL